jgi:hypothetical protein
VVGYLESPITQTQNLKGNGRMRRHSGVIGFLIG